ncbi:MAG: 2-hexaprenyl-6-methoxy-1,4-benzoquinone methyltransferase [Peltula sp. TS41687]|nr:MAG: 2-hexaprenyl-6-methoxy-1,4-benzoquinone methyltransferase [Peltula sp. TS41687]
MAIRSMHRANSIGRHIFTRPTFIQQQPPYRCLSCTRRLLQLQQQADPPPPPPPQPSSPPSPTGERTTHFGFQDVAESQKEAKVGAVFSSVAANYDTMNDLMSFGIHRLWKDAFVRLLNPGVKRGPPPTASTSTSTSATTATATTTSTAMTSPDPAGWSILDIAGGTGDIAIRLLDHAALINHDTSSRVTVADINGPMLAEGRLRAAKTHKHYLDTGRLSFMQANAENLQGIVPDASLDLYTVAFGIRNFTRKDEALREAFRVLKPGGVFACLEFSSVKNPLLDWAYGRWSFAVIPLIGQLVAADRDSYQYLVESIRRFPSQETFRDMIADAGFLVPEGKGWVDLTGGIAAVHRGVKPV